MAVPASGRRLRGFSLPRGCPPPSPLPPTSATTLSGDETMPALQEAAAQPLDTTAPPGALTALKRGDCSARLPVEWTGVAGKVADTFNDVIELNQRMARELEHLSRVVGK